MTVAMNVQTGMQVLAHFILRYVSPNVYAVPTPRRWRRGNPNVHTFGWSEPACCWATMLNEGESQWQPALHDPSEQQCDVEQQTVMRHCTEHSGSLQPMNEATRGWKPPDCSPKEK